MDGVHFDLVITDMKMPEMDGLELLRRIRQQKKHLPVIILTGYADPKSEIEAIRAGCSHFISKPFTLSQGNTEGVKSWLPF